MAFGPTAEDFGAKSSKRTPRRRSDGGSAAATKLYGDVAPHIKDVGVKGKERAVEVEAAGTEDAAPRRKEKRLRQVATGMDAASRWKGGLKELVEGNKRDTLSTELEAVGTPSKRVKPLSSRMLPNISMLDSPSSSKDPRPVGNGLHPGRPLIPPPVPPLYAPGIPKLVEGKPGKDLTARALPPESLASVFQPAPPEAGPPTKPLVSLAAPPPPAQIPPKRPQLPEDPSNVSLATAPAFDLSILAHAQPSAAATPGAEADPLASLVSPPKRRRTTGKGGLLPFGLAERAQSVIERQRSGWGMWRSDFARGGEVKANEITVWLRVGSVEWKGDFGRVLVAFCTVVDPGLTEHMASEEQQGLVIFSLHLAFSSSPNSFSSRPPQPASSEPKTDPEALPPDPFSASRKPITTPYELAKEVKPGRMVWGIEPWTVVSLLDSSGEPVEGGEGRKALVLTRFGVWR